MTAAIGPFVFVPVGDAWIRVDLIATVSEWEVTTLQGMSVPLNDTETAEVVLDEIRKGYGLTRAVIAGEQLR
jgi:hypothetical protein